VNGGRAARSARGAIDEVIVHPLDVTAGRASDATCVLRS
jgi:hypothetical protein